MRHINKHTPLEDLNAQRDAAILAGYHTVGDAEVLAKRFGVNKVHVYRVIHAAEIKKASANASELAQAVMKTGDVVYALPATHLQSSVGAEALVNSLQSAIRASGTDTKVLIAVAIIPVEEITATLPLQNAKAVAASLQAKVVNRIGVRA